MMWYNVVTDIDMFALFSASFLGKESDDRASVTAQASVCAVFVF